MRPKSNDHIRSQARDAKLLADSGVRKPKRRGPKSKADIIDQLGESLGTIARNLPATDRDRLAALAGLGPDDIVALAGLALTYAVGDLSAPTAVDRSRARRAIVDLGHLVRQVRKDAGPDHDEDAEPVAIDWSGTDTDGDDDVEASTIPPRV